MKVYIKNKIVSLGGSSTVKDASGKDIYKVQGRALSLTRVKKICDMDDNVLYKVRNRWFNFFIHSSFIYDAQTKKRIVKVKNRFFKPGFDIISDGTEMRVDGKWFSTTATIVRDNVPVGYIRREFANAADVLFRDSFEFEGPDDEMPFLIALVIAIDNIVDNVRN